MERALVWHKSNDALEVQYAVLVRDGRCRDHKLSASRQLVEPESENVLANLIDLDHKIRPRKTRAHVQCTREQSRVDASRAKMSRRPLSVAAATRFTRVKVSSAPI